MDMEEDMVLDLALGKNVALAMEEDMVLALGENVALELEEVVVCTQIYTARRHQTRGGSQRQGARQQARGGKTVSKWKVRGGCQRAW